MLDINVALKYGYDSLVSFLEVKLKAYPRISFQILIKEEKEMNYRIERKEAFDVFGIETVASLVTTLNTCSYFQNWKEYCSSIRFR